MKNTWILPISLLLIMSAYSAKAQRFDVPSNYTFETKADYHKYDNDIIRCVNWLEKTPPKDNGKFKRANDFLVEWLTGCPYVHFSQNVKIDASFTTSPDLLIYYMGGWARYALQNQGNATKAQCSVAGIRCMLRVYDENRSITRDANIDELASEDKQGKLQEWVDDRM